MIKQYRKKPVVIEAVKFEYSEAGIKELQDFCGKCLVKWGKDRHINAVGWAHIATLEDGDENSVQVEHVAPEGDNGDNQETFTVWLRNVGQCLVPDQDNTTIEVSLRDGTVQRGRANEFDWRIIGDAGDILHYRGILNKD